MAGEWLGQLANFEDLKVVLLLNFIFMSENHITVVAVGMSHFESSKKHNPWNVAPS